MLGAQAIQLALQFTSPRFERGILKHGDELTRLYPFTVLRSQAHNKTAGLRAQLRTLRQPHDTLRHGDRGHRDYTHRNDDEHSEAGSDQASTQPLRAQRG